MNLRVLVSKLKILKKKWKGKNSTLREIALKEKMDKSIDDRVLKLFREKLNEDVLLADLDRTHRIGKKVTQAANHVQLL